MSHFVTVTELEEWLGNRSSVGILMLVICAAKGSVVTLALVAFRTLPGQEKCKGRKLIICVVDNCSLDVAVLVPLQRRNTINWVESHGKPQKTSSTQRRLGK
ncbi:hypothetical protein BJY00DRAFT_279323 [Aspergillus carlsbadensis]|nr:hypothetical protein BJY00DRAFT_279323 [Aspergillus carlsbadensis]